MIKIAIIEDDKGLNNGIALALKNENYQFAQFFSLTEALNAQLYSDTDLIILDINLPDGNGFDYISFIRIHTHSRVAVDAAVITHGVAQSETVQQGGYYPRF